MAITKFLILALLKNFKHSKINYKLKELQLTSLQNLKKFFWLMKKLLLYKKIIIKKMQKL